MRLLLVLSFVFPAHFMHAEIIRDLMSMLEEEHAPMTLSILGFVGKYKPLGESFPDLLGELTPLCKVYISGEGPKRAKQAVKCLFMNTPKEKHEEVFADVLESVKANLEPAKGETYITAIVALGHLAFHLPDNFTVQIKNLVSRKIVKELLMKVSNITADSA